MSNSISCEQCSIATGNAKFCSRRCAAIYNNTKNPKRKRVHYPCSVCGALLTRRRKYCDAHRPKPANYTYVTVGELEHYRSKYNQPYSIIRLRARTVIERRGGLVCAVCGYSRHVDAAHIKPISSFPKDTLIDAINSSDNIVALCPTHHWELDHGFIDAATLSK